MFELILKRPTVSHTVQTVSQRLRRLLRRLVMPLAVAAVVFFGLGLYWSIPARHLRRPGSRFAAVGGRPEKTGSGRRDHGHSNRSRHYAA